MCVWNRANDRETMQRVRARFVCVLSEWTCAFEEGIDVEAVAAEHWRVEGLDFLIFLGNLG